MILVSHVDLPFLQSLFHTAPATDLLRSRTAPFVIDFLHGRFKAANRKLLAPGVHSFTIK